MPPLDTIEAHIVRHTLSPEGQAQYETGDVAKRELLRFVEPIRQISSHYLQHSVGQRLSSPISSATHAEAYALYYTAINAAKIVHVLPELKLPSRELSVLDLGSGPGTVGLALLASLRSSIALTCVESSSAMRTLASKLLSNFSASATLSSLSLCSALSSVPAQQYDLVIAANVLAELEEEAAQSALTHLIGAVTPHGYLLLLEPGQHQHTRRLMRIRDQVLQKAPILAPIFPCCRADACPMVIASEKDWCHGSLDFAQPRLNAQLDELLGFNKHRIKYSAFLFQHGGVTPDGIRVLTPPERTSAGVESLVCGSELYGVIRIAKRNRSEATRAFEKAAVFDRLLLSQPCLGEAPKELTVSLPGAPGKPSHSC
jgi:ribosomal protein RSM22 (predicted rRNA methylase)